MNYPKIYQDFIESRRGRSPGKGEYSERHHVIPRCMGGGDEPENFIQLIPEDHFFAHVVLAKAYGGKPLWAAVKIMAAKVEYLDLPYWRIRKLYAIVKLQTDISGSKHPMYDNKVYTFYHLDGSQFIGTKFEFKSKIGKRNICDLFNGRQTTVHGWSINPIKKEDYKKWRSKINKINHDKGTYGARDKMVYKFIHKTHGITIETCHGMKKKYLVHSSHIRALINGELKTHAGWKIYNGPQT